MGKNPDIDEAYAMTSPDEVKALYRTWSHSYDVGFGEGQGYQLPREVATAFIGAGGQGPVLDVGAGTGLVGTFLHRMKATPIDGIDLSEEMLELARLKGDYRGLSACDVTQPLTGLDGPYQGVVSAGTFTLGHVGPDALGHLLKVAATGALFVISVNAAHYASAGFEAAFAELGDRITDRCTRDVRIYDDRADDAHSDDMARLVIFRKA
ncbi:class I SAM-dependent DNA methyltransferase [Loktanella sp. Alg231-35]|uniref:class I SAM-dependent DNA methyltransferase n=1 Tax=Loktanella sp. Alg231-35 TaxID=1922220 RepID=UPI000D54D20E|nr:class I SAM-dependent methyltransferase [Loktanella sp. Alg231-35]